MAKWLVIGGVATLLYLVVTGKPTITLQPGGKARPSPQGPLAQNPAPPMPPQNTVVAGAGSGILEDAQKAAGIIGSLADAAKKFGLFGGDDEGPATVSFNDGTGTGIQRDPSFDAAFF
jgi:hypothetical protein